MTKKAKNILFIVVTFIALIAIMFLTILPSRIPLNNDDTVGNTLVAASTLEKDVKAELEKTNNVDAAAYVGKVIAKSLMNLISGN